MEKTRKCIVCGKVKDFWEYFTEPEQQVCKSCRLKALVQTKEKQKPFGE